MQIYPSPNVPRTTKAAMPLADDTHVCVSPPTSRCLVRQKTPPPQRGGGVSSRCRVSPARGSDQLIASLSSVAESSVPVCSRPFLACQLFSALSVSGPITPSTWTLYPCSLSADCTRRTWSSLLDIMCESFEAVLVTRPLASVP